MSYNDVLLWTGANYADGEAIMEAPDRKGN